jgi:hypothetical protein
MPIATPKNLNAFTGHPNYRTNQSAARHNGSYVDPSNCCALCGKKALGNKTFVLLTNIGEYTTKEEMAEHDATVVARGGCPDDLGLYPVGATCMKQLTAAGVTIYDWEMNAVATPKGPVTLKDRS